ncbi:LysR family transcriptional regulator [Variovorax defluvii]|uniref:LysR family transcriptional regulator n=1 Tax=Variovorax defluvii TaxID=913761 RepID=A0ABP8I9C6_9BURK
MGSSNLNGQADQLDLYQLQVIDVLLREQSLTKAALVLNTTQPALSKTLARLRSYFDDPLFIRVSLSMEPTPKAQSLAVPIRLILDEMQMLRCAQVPFDPRTSDRSFSFFAVDAAMVVMLPALVKALHSQAPAVRLRAVQLDEDHLHAWLKSGKVDLAIGYYPALTQGIRRQRLYSAVHLSLVRKGHPRLSTQPSLEAFAAEQHVLVSASGTGHGIEVAEHVLEAAIPASHFTVRVPSFTAAAVVAKHTDAVVTLPSPLAEVLARELDLDVVKPPLRLPGFEVAQYWHERFHREPGNQWFRALIHQRFCDSA